MTFEYIHDIETIIIIKNIWILNQPSAQVSMLFNSVM